MQELLHHIKSMAAELSAEIVSIRRHLHQHPELSFEEYKTSEFVCSVLDAHHISYTEGMVKTGIVALIEGNNPAAKTILLRADLDALLIGEKNDVSYKSQ